VSVGVHAPYMPAMPLGRGTLCSRFSGPVAYQLSVTSRECPGLVSSHAQPITPTSEMGWCGACGDEGRVVAGEVGGAMEARRLNGFGERHLRQDRGEANGPHRLDRPRSLEPQAVTIHILAAPWW
jgi:hypothetical protein